MKQTLTQTALQVAETTLINNGLILTPTDTIWGLSACVSNAAGADRICRLKQRPLDMPLIVLVSSVEMLERYTGSLPAAVIDEMTLSERPTTVVFDEVRELPARAYSAAETVALRVVRFSFLQQLINRLGEPIFSTSANLHGQPSPKRFADLTTEMINGVDYLVPAQLEAGADTASRMLTWNRRTNRFETLRA